MRVLLIIVTAISAYLIGSVNSSILISKAISGKDIRESGSGNAGATNMLRTHGKKMGVITLLVDIFKGVVAIVAAYFIADLLDGYISGGFSSGLSQTAPLPEPVDHDIFIYIAGVFVILGHDFPVFFGFKGGKGVATSLGVVLMLDWKIGLLIAVCAIAVMAVTRYVSLGSVLGGAAFIVGEIVEMISTQNFGVVKLICVLIIGGLLIVRHKENIKRLLNGTENKLGSKSKG